MAIGDILVPLKKLVIYIRLIEEIKKTKDFSRIYGAKAMREDIRVLKNRKKKLIL